MSVNPAAYPGKSASSKPDIQKLVKYVFLVLFTLLWLIPIGAALVTAFRTSSDISINGFWSLPESVTFQNFVKAWRQAQVSKFLLNSFIITLPAVLFVLFFASLSAYALARYRFRGNALFYFMYVGGSMLPYQILMVPVFKLSSELGLYNTHASLILIHVAYQLAFATFLLRNFTRGVPAEIVEAARVDGCSEFRIYYQMILPLTLPALAAIATLEFTWIFNDYLWAIILVQSDALKPVTAGLAMLRGQYNTDWPLIVAGALLASIPTVVVFFALQRYFIQGLTLGSNK